MNQKLLSHRDQEQIEVIIERVEPETSEESVESELDEMWSYVRTKANPRWLWHGIDRRTGDNILAYVFGQRQDEVFLK